MDLDHLKGLEGVPILPVEEVARIFLEHEASNPFSVVKRGSYEHFEWKQSLVRLTELLRRARMDGAREYLQKSKTS